MNVEFWIVNLTIEFEYWISIINIEFQYWIWMWNLNIEWEFMAIQINLWMLCQVFFLTIRNTIVYQKITSPFIIHNKIKIQLLSSIITNMIRSLNSLPARIKRFPRAICWSIIIVHAVYNTIVWNRVTRFHTYKLLY